AAIFIGGLPHAWIGIGLLSGMFFNWLLVAGKIRDETEKYNAYTLSAYFSGRYRDDKGTINFITAIMAVIFLTCYLAAGLIAMGYLLESLFGIDYYFGLTVATLVAMTYTFMGGYSTVAKVDGFQAVFLFFILIIVPVVAYLSLPDGIQDIVVATESKAKSLSFFNLEGDNYFFGTLSLILGWGLGYFGQPHIITKFMGISSSSEMRKAMIVGMTWQTVTLTAAAAIGIIGIAYFPEGLQNPELVFVEIVKDLFPKLIGGFILCGVLAANMSTMDSQILVCASVLSEDLYKKLLRPDATPLELLRVSRIGVVIVSIFSLVIAFKKSSTVLDAVLYAWSGLGCTFGPLILMGLYYKKANKFGAITGVLVGGIIAGVWPHVNLMIVSYPIPSMIPGFTLSMLSIYIFSNLTQQPAE
ncbi:MAG: sodium/proline symporter, partial [Chlamydiales bacterium]|nr:sodium/proline symporter [Chlamydiales bacterium]